MTDDPDCSRDLLHRTRQPMNSMGLMAIFFALIIFGVFVVGVIVTLVACVQRNWKFAKRSILVTLGVVVLSIAASMGIMEYVWRPYDPTSPTELGEAYRADFGALPPSGVTVLHARQVIVGDAGAQWLLLKASPEEITRHIALFGFTCHITSDPAFDGRAGANAPPWWTPPAHGLELYENTNWTKQGGWTDSRATIGVDRAAGLVWFVANKINWTGRR